MKTLLITTFSFIILFHFIANAQAGRDTTNQPQDLPKGEKGSSNYFTGNVWVKALANDTASACSVAKVTFEPNARSNWHFHPDKQVLIITSGIGYLKEKDKPIQILRNGDVVTIQPGVVHWHGATPESEFVQIVVNRTTDKSVVTWLQKVTDEEYRSGK